MSVALPAGICPNAFSMLLVPVMRASSSPFGGSEQTVDLLQDRWSVAMSLPPRTRDNAAALEAFLNGIRANTVDLYHWVRKVPRGTMRGTPVAWGTARGANVLSITTTAGATLLAGDMIGVAGLLLQVAADATADGSGRLDAPLANRLRKAIPTDAPVVWDRPTAPFRLVSPMPVQHVPGYAEGLALDFIEDVTQ
ncbi:hypothetical protein [Xenophilus sp.]|uniref:hypothetical protein n=1 Tax=Xenophilus sp. TaxID=1873499 RepID=UPI0037DD5692